MRDLDLFYLLRSPLRSDVSYTPSSLFGKSLGGLIMEEGTDVLSRVRGLFGDGGNRHKKTVVKIELENLAPEEAANIVEKLRKKYHVPAPLSTRPVAVGISLQVQRGSSISLICRVNVLREQLENGKADTVSRTLIIAFSHSVFDITFSYPVTNRTRKCDNKIGMKPECRQTFTCPLASSLQWNCVGRKR